MCLAFFSSILCNKSHHLLSSSSAHEFPVSTRPPIFCIVSFLKLSLMESLAQRRETIVYQPNGPVCSLTAVRYRASTLYHHQLATVSIIGLSAFWPFFRKVYKTVTGGTVTEFIANHHHRKSHLLAANLLFVVSLHHHLLQANPLCVRSSLFFALLRVTCFISV